MNLCTPLIYNVLAIFLGAVSAALWAASSQVKFPGALHDGGEAQTKAWNKASRINGWAAAVMAVSMVFMAFAQLVTVAAWCR